MTMGNKGLDRVTTSVYSTYMTHTTYPYCTECPTKAAGEYIVKMFGEKRGVRVALCEHHLTEKTTGEVFTVKPVEVRA